MKPSAVECGIRAYEKHHGLYRHERVGSLPVCKKRAAFLSVVKKVVDR